LFANIKINNTGIVVFGIILQSINQRPSDKGSSVLVLCQSAGPTENPQELFLLSYLDFLIEFFMCLSWKVTVLTGCARIEFFLYY
jgi:hypothetical protein